MPKPKYIQAQLPGDLAEWVDETLEHGQKGAFIISCFENLRTLMTDGALPPPSEYARLATIVTITQMATRGGA
jgi:hypothetical protein